MYSNNSCIVSDNPILPERDGHWLKFFCCWSGWLAFSFSCRVRLEFHFLFIDRVCLIFPEKCENIISNDNKKYLYMNKHIYATYFFPEKNKIDSRGTIVSHFLVVALNYVLIFYFIYLFIRIRFEVRKSILSSRT